MNSSRELSPPRRIQRFTVFLLEICPNTYKDYRGSITSSFQLVKSELQYNPEEFDSNSDGCISNNLCLSNTK